MSKQPTEKEILDALNKLDDTQCDVTEAAFDFTTKPKPQPVKQPQQQPTKRKHAITFADTKCIREHEGHSLKAYPDPATNGDPWTISYGLTGPWVKKGLVITQAESDKRFMEYVDEWCEQLDKIIKVDCTRNQYIAMLSLSWNIGIPNFSKSTLLKKVNAKDFAGAANEFIKWNKAAGKVMNGLTKRRNDEKELFLKP